MREINAFWEERNTGLKTCELIFDPSDKIVDYKNSLFENNYEYIVAKIPIQNIILVHELEDIGFRFMETQLNISVETQEIEQIKRKWRRFLSNTSYKKLESKNEIELLTHKIKDGMFKDDRISIDEKLADDISSTRYINWITDIYEKKSADIFLIKKYSSFAGFFVIKRADHRTYQALIAGIFKEYQGQGLPLALFYYYLKIASEKNGINVITSFSSNNLKMFNSFTRTISFKILEIFYVLRKIC